MNVLSRRAHLCRGQGGTPHIMYRGTASQEGHHDRNQLVDVECGRRRSSWASLLIGKIIGTVLDGNHIVFQRAVSASSKSVNL
jgi:hypothetical protein